MTESEPSEAPRSGWVEEWTYNLVVLSFYLPVVAGSLLYLFFTGGEYAVVSRTLGDQPGMAI
ncbi:MAG: hypothetical protein AAF211_28005, partial [Myxococcota bacterium]